MEKLGKLVEINSGDSPSKFKMVEEGIPFFKVEQLNNSTKYQTDSIYFINEPKKVISKGSVIFPKRGASILLNKIRILKQPSFMDTNLMTLTANAQLNNEYLYYFILREDLSTLADTTSIPQINNKHILPYPIALPTLPEQQKIASFLSKVDEKIALLIEKKDKLTEYKKGVMQQLFNGKWDEQDGQLNFIPPTLRFKADDGSEFPDWEEKNIGSLGKVVTGSTPKTSDSENYGGDKLFISPADLNGRKFIHTTKNLVTQKGFSSGRILPKESVCFVCIGSTIGKVAMNAHEAITNQQINSIVVDNSKFDSGLVFALLEKEAMKIKMLAGEQAVPIINKSEFSKYKLLVPIKTEQTKIANFLSAIDQKIDLTNSELDKAKEWKKGLLQQMFV